MKSAPIQAKRAHSAAPTTPSLEALKKAGAKFFYLPQTGGGEPDETAYQSRFVALSKGNVFRVTYPGSGYGLNDKFGVSPAVARLEKEALSQDLASIANNADSRPTQPLTPAQIKKDWSEHSFVGLVEALKPNPRTSSVYVNKSTNEVRIRWAGRSWNASNWTELVPLPR